MSEFKPRKPDYRIKALIGTGDARRSQVIGSAWVGESGRISIHLEPLIVLRGLDLMTITMFPIEKSNPKTT